MMTERDVCEVDSGVEEKSGVVISSYQDLPKPGCNGIGCNDQSGDPENSYVFVTRSDGQVDGFVDKKDVVAVDASIQLESVAPVESQVMELDSVNEEVYKSMKEGMNETVEERDRALSAVNGITVENEFSLMDGDRLIDSLEVADLDANENLNVGNQKIDKPLKEERENVSVESTDRNPSNVNGFKVEQVSYLDDADGIQDTEDHNRKNKCSKESEIDQVEIPIGKMETLEVIEERIINDQHTETEIATESEQKKVEIPIGKMETLEVIEKRIINDQHTETEIATESEQKKADDQTVIESSPGIQRDEESDAPNLGLVSESGEVEELNNLSALNGSIKTCDACESDIDSGSTDASQLLVEDAPKSQSKDLSEEENEIKSVGETVEAVEPDVPLIISLNLNLEGQPIKNRRDTIEHAETALSTEENQNSDSVPIDIVETSLSEEQDLSNYPECITENGCNQVLEGKNENLSVCNSEDHSLHPEVSVTHTFFDGLSPEMTSSQTETVGPAQSASFPDSGVEAQIPPTEIKDHGAKTVGVISSSSIHGPKPEIAEKGLLDPDNLEASAETIVISNSYSTDETVVCIEREPTFHGDYACNGTDVSVVNSVDGHSPHASAGVKLELEVHKNVDMIGDVMVSSRTEALDSSVTDQKGASNIILKSADTAVVGEVDNLDENHISKTSLEIGMGMSDDAVTKPFNFLVRIPRFNDENLRDKINDAKLEVAEKTKLRAAIQAKIQEKRASNQIHGVDYEHAKGEDRSIRRSLKLTRMEIESLQSLINKAKNAKTIEDMDSRINNMEHMIQHETLPLREEKQLIHEIKQLKQLREQLYSNMGSHKEIQQALEQRDEAEEQLKTLKQELGNLKNRVSKAKSASVEAESKYEDENKKVKELQEQFRAADDVRQAAYAAWQSLRKELYEKNKDFFKHKEDESAANNYAVSRNRKALYHVCTEQVENFMERWNRDAEFRSEYTRSNTRSTVRRFGTLDGRSLGPDEKPYVLPNYLTNERMISTPENVDSITLNPSLELNQQIAVENLTSDASVLSVKREKERKKQIVDKKEPPTSKSGNSSDNAYHLQVSDEVQEEESAKRKEEIELIRKEEETRREEAEAMKKEELRLMQIAKAKEAREKKKRNEEKAKLREELRAQKEAELKEKEREKKMRKKERKMAAATNDNNENSESVMEIEKEEVQANDIAVPETTKKPKASTVYRQNKAKSIPPPLRIRSKKKWQQWIWVFTACISIILLFCLGNMGLFDNITLRQTAWSTAQ